MNPKVVIAFAVTFFIILTLLVKEDISQYSKMVRLHEDGIKTTAALLEYEVEERRARGFLKYDRHIFIYEYFDENNIQHQYRITHGQLHFKDQLKEGTISILYNPNEPEEAIETSKLKVISNLEFSFNIIISFALSLFCTFMIFLLLKTTFPLNKWKHTQATP